jgi:hypothetical protein
LIHNLAGIFLNDAYIAEKTERAVKKSVFCVGVIGPTNVELIESVVPLAPGTLEGAARRIGAFLAKNSFGLVSVPDRGVGLWVLEGYRSSGGNNSLALSPTGADTLDNCKDLTPRHVSKANQVRTDLSWEEAPAQMVRESDCLVCIGISCGTIIELAWTKWIRRFPVIVVESFITGLPIEVMSEINVRLTSNMDQTEKLLLELAKESGVY